MSSPSGSGLQARALFAAGTASYDCPEFPALDKVADSLRTVVGTLQDLGFAVMARAPGYRLDPALTSLSSAVHKAAATAPVVVVVYYTGHGADLERGSYYLVGKKSRPADLARSALAAGDLLELLTLRDDRGELLSDQPTVLVMLDCCYSGRAGMRMLRDELDGIGNPNIWVLASAGPLEYAQQGRFAQALREALDQPTAGPSQRFLSLDALVGVINRANRGRAEQVARVFAPPTGSTDTPPFFPNKDFCPDLAGLTVDEQHWRSRVRGGPEETTTGSYLTGQGGRILAAERLVTWMTGPRPPGLAVVTGSPGTGKSALLSLPVLLTQQTWRENLLSTAEPGSLIRRTAELLPADTPIVAVHARGLNADQAAGIIAQALGRDLSSATALLESLDAAPPPSDRVLVIDAVDEAASPATVLSGLALPLARQPGLRVVIGARRHVLPAAGDADLLIDFDTSQYHDPRALTTYVHRLLIADAEPGVTTPYQKASGRGAADKAAEVAAAIARRATAREGGPESFLIGRLLALAVRSRPQPVDVSTEGWQAELPASVAEAFDEDLARLGGKRSLARTLLTALAWAKGPGLPWETIWVPVASAIADLDGATTHSQISDDDVRWLLAEAGAYIVEDLGAGRRSVYRPFHDLLAAHLRGEPSAEPQAPDLAAAPARNQHRARAETAITQSLVATVPPGVRGGLDWLAAHPYLRAYLAQHAAAAGTATLAELAQDRDFLACADPLTLTPLLSPTVPELRDAARAYRRARPLLRDDPHANLAHLLEADRALKTTAAPAANTEIHPLYHTVFASVRTDDSLLTLTGHTGAVYSVAFGTTADGRLLLATGSYDRTARVWDPLTGGPVGEPLTGHTNAVSSVAFGTTADGRLLLATGSVDNTARVWDPLTGGPVGEPLTGHTDRVDSVAFGTTADGRLLLATGGEDNTARVWDPVTGAPVGEPLSGHAAPVDSVAFGSTADGRLLLALGSYQGTARVWDPVTGTRIGKRLDILHGNQTSVAFGTTADGRLLLALGCGETARVWDPLTRARTSKWLESDTGTVYSVAFGTTADGRLLLATGGGGNTARVWDPVTGGPVGEPLTGHTAPVTSVAFGTTAGGRLLLVTGSDHHTIREWDPVSGTALGVFLRRAGVISLAVCGPMLAVGDWEGVSVIESIQEWKPV
jgi:WD40 repeat protein